MSNPISDKLINLAWEVVNLKGRDKQIDFGKGTDYQGELHISWNDNKFFAFLIVYTEPYTSGLGSYFYPPETIWREQETEFSSVKIRDVADWLERDWKFILAI
jgi:hypothetical protein